MNKNDYFMLHIKHLLFYIYILFVTFLSIQSREIKHRHKDLPKIPQTEVISDSKYTKNRHCVM